jgi:hypothetical protein
MSGVRAQVMMGLTVWHAGFDGYRAKLAVSDAFLGDHRLSERHHGIRRTSQNHAFNTVFVVEMGVKRRHRDLVVPMLHRDESLRQLSLVMVVDVAQNANAVFGVPELQAPPVELVPKQITEGLRTVFVTLRAHQGIEGIRQVVIHRYRQSTHIAISVDPSGHYATPALHP